MVCKVRGDDHVVWAPLQSDLAHQLMEEYGLSNNIIIEADGKEDYASAVAIDEEGAHLHIKGLMRCLWGAKFPFNVIGCCATALPACITTPIYHCIARNRGTIWKSVKKTFALTDTYLHEEMDYIAGTDWPQSYGLNQKPPWEAWPRHYGFENVSREVIEESREPACSCLPFLGSCGRGIKAKA